MAAMQVPFQMSVDCNFKTRGFPGGSVVKKPPANAGDMGLNPMRQEDPLEKEIATHFSILVWRIPWTEEPGRL